MAEIWNLNTICRCCHTDGNFKSLREPYTVGEEKEIYESMLRDVFAIAIFQITTATFEASYTICEQCIMRLKDAARFKKQVLECEQKFHVYCKNEQFFAVPTDTAVKIEVTQNEPVCGNDYEDTFTCNNSTVTDLKKEYKIEVDIKHEIEGEVADKQTNKVISKLYEIKKENQIKQEKKKIIKETKKKKAKPKTVRSLIQITKSNGQTIFTCKHCEGTFKSKNLTKTHIHRDHKDVISFECVHCSRVFLTTNSFGKHMKLHNGDQRPICEYCGQKFYDTFVYLKHRRAHEKAQVFVCDICNKQFRYRSTLRKHFKWHAGTNRKELCEQCGRGFNDSTNLRIHIRTVHERQRPYRCDLCGADFTAKKYLKPHIIAHMETMPNGHQGTLTKYFECKLCPKKFKCPKSLKLHLLRHENKYQCRVCNKIFDDLFSYKSHTHKSTEIKHSCNICTKEFSSSYTLKRHLDAHNDVRRFPCEQCPLKFIDKQQLKRHLDRVHDPNSPYSEKTQCLICKRRVKDISKHMETHEYKKFSCMYCPNSYVENKSLKRHIQTMHFGKVYTCDVCSKNVISLKSLKRHKFRVHNVLKSEVITDSESQNNVSV